MTSRAKSKLHKYWLKENHASLQYYLNTIIVKLRRLSCCVFISTRLDKYMHFVHISNRKSVNMFRVNVPTNRPWNGCVPPPPPPLWEFLALSCLILQYLIHRMRHVSSRRSAMCSTWYFILYQFLVFAFLFTMIEVWWNEIPNNSCVGGGGSGHYWIFYREGYSFVGLCDIFFNILLSIKTL